MKPTLFLITLLVLFFSCMGQGGSSDKHAKNAGNEIASENIESDNYANTDEDDPFSQLIAEYSPQQLKQLLGKAEPQDVRDFLALLPDSLCYDYSAADRKKVAQGERVGDFGGMALGEVDTSNGYLNLSGAWEGTWEMFAKKMNGTWWVAVNQQYCGPMCYTHIANTYTFKNGTLTRHTHANLAGYQDVWAELFIDFEQLTESQKKQVNEIWEENGMNAVLFRLPRDGKTITMYIDMLPYLDAEIPETAVKEVTAEIWQ